MSIKKNRYPGVVPFTSEQQDIFFGREKDIEKLAQLIRREQQILLYAKSGLGKSSLVNAGVVPLLKTEMLPIFVRFGAYQEGISQTLLETLLSSLPKKPTTFLDQKLPKQESLWLHFKALQIQKEQTFLLVLDQFEEIFSYPKEQITEFKKQVADLLLRETPLEISEWIEQNEKQNTDFLTEEEEDSIWQKSTVKVLTVIREDRYSLMNQLTDYLPYILNNRYRLASLDQNQARQAIVEPAQKEGDFESEKFVYQKPALDKIVKFLTKDYTQEIETTQLQILCNRLENLKLTEITANDIPNFEDIFLQFYEDTITKIENKSEQLKARRFVENELIKQEQRISLDALVCTEFVEQETLKTIVNEHLLNTQENSIGRISYELAHDTLVTPILQAKRKREKEEEAIERERLQKEELRIANEKAEIDRLEKEKTKKQLRKVQIILAFAIIALFIAMGTGWYAFEKKTEADKKKIEADESADIAKKAEANARNSAKKAEEKTKQAQTALKGFLEVKMKEFEGAINTFTQSGDKNLAKKYQKSKDSLQTQYDAINLQLNNK
jgi:hypothetical protein